MDRQPFIGVGHNPEGPDLPLGLGMQLAQEPEAITRFGQLSANQKQQLVDYIQSCSTGEDAQNRVAEVVQGLSQNNLSFLP